MSILETKRRTCRSKIKFRSSIGAEKLEPITSKKEERPGEKKRRISEMCSEEDFLSKRTKLARDSYNIFSTTTDPQLSEQQWKYSPGIVRERGAPIQFVAFTLSSRLVLLLYVLFLKFIALFMSLLLFFPAFPSLTLLLFLLKVALRGSSFCGRMISI